MRSKPIAVEMPRIVAASSFVIAVPWRRWRAIQPTMIKEEHSAAQVRVYPTHLLSSGQPWLCEREEKRRLGSGGFIIRTHKVDFGFLKYTQGVSDGYSGGGGISQNSLKSSM